MWENIVPILVDLLGWWCIVVEMWKYQLPPDCKWGQISSQYSKLLMLLNKIFVGLQWKVLSKCFASPQNNELKIRKIKKGKEGNHGINIFSSEERLKEPTWMKRRTLRRGKFILSPMKGEYLFRVSGNGTPFGSRTRSQVSQTRPTW